MVFDQTTVLYCVIIKYIRQALANCLLGSCDTRVREDWSHYVKTIQYQHKHSWNARNQRWPDSRQQSAFLLAILIRHECLRPHIHVYMIWKLNLDTEAQESRYIRRIWNISDHLKLNFKKAKKLNASWRNLLHEWGSYYTV